MFLKREKEFQYHPGIELLLEDVVGGGTIARADLTGAIFRGVPLKELPPIVVVCEDSKTGLYHVLKTAEVHESADATAKAYKVKKKHVFVVGDVVTVGGDFSGAADVIKTIDKSNAEYDILTLNGTIGEAAAGKVLVQAKEKAEAGAARMKYDHELAITMNKVDLTVANQQSGLLVRGTVNEYCMPFPIDQALKAKMSHIRFVYKPVNK